MSTSKVTSDLLRGNTDTMILRLLTESDRYGYEIVKLIAERSQGEYELKEATMYSSVRAEKLADRIAILHQGTIIVSGTLAELRKLLPPAKAELVERQPTLEEIFLSIVGNKEGVRL